MLHVFQAGVGDLARECRLLPLTSQLQTQHSKAHAQTHLFDRHLVLLLLSLETHQLCVAPPVIEPSGHHTHTHTHTHTHKRTHTHTHTHVRTHTHAHKHTHTYIHTYTHTVTHLSSSSFWERIRLICSRSLCTSVSASIRACRIVTGSVKRRSIVSQYCATCAREASTYCTCFMELFSTSTSTIFSLYSIRSGPGVSTLRDENNATEGGRKEEREARR